MKSDLSQTLKSHYNIIIDEKLLYPITNAGDNVLFQYNSTYVIKIYQDYAQADIEQSCFLLQKFNGSEIVVENNRGEYVTKFNGSFVVLMKYLKGRACHPSSQDDVNRVIALIKKIPNLNFKPNIVCLLDKECEIKFNLLLAKQSVRLLKYRQNALLLVNRLKTIDTRFLQTQNIVSTHHDINPDNIIIAGRDSYLLDWDKSRSAYYIDEVCRAAFLFMIQTKYDKMALLESFQKAVDSVTCKQYFDMCFLAGADIYAEIILCCLECESEEIFLSNLPHHLHPSNLYKNLELIMLRIEEIDNF